MDLKRKEGESELAFIWRIGNAKDNGLIDLTWSDFGDICNKELISDETLYRTESAFRKSYQYAKMFYDEVFSKYEEDSYIKELETKKREIQKERQKLNTTKNEYIKDIRKQSRFELLYEQIKDVVKKLPEPELKEVLTPNEEADYILTIADIHCGANFISENNEYSMDICKERFDFLLSETVKFIKSKGLKKITVLELGDSIQGILRLNDLKANERSVVEATVFVARLISNFLNILSSYCLVDYYHCPTSNHSQIRPLSSKASELASEDIEYIISNYIKDSLSNNERISVNINNGKEYIDFEINGFNVIAMHGHQIKNINTSLRDLSNLHRKFYDILFLAHYHSGDERVVGENVLCDTEVIICPSFVGSDPYSDGLLKGSKSSCKIYGISNFGHTETYKIILN